MNYSMNRLFGTVGLLLVGLQASSANAGHVYSKTRSFGLEPLKVDEDFPSGCGCSVQNDSGGTIFFSGIKEKAPGIIKIKGKKRQLKLISSTKGADKPKVGDSFTKKYGKGEIKLQLDFTVTEVCAPADESCEATGYEVHSILERGPSTREGEKLKGNCGC